MIIVYGMESCPDCRKVKQVIAADARYDYRDIGVDVHNLRDFLQLRDHNPVFAAVKAAGSVGIPCFLMEDGSVSLKLPACKSTEATQVKTKNSTAACSLNGQGC